MPTLQLVRTVVTGEKEMRPGAPVATFLSSCESRTCTCYKPACEHSLTYIANCFIIIQLIKMNVSSCPRLQTDELITSLEKSNVTNRNLTVNERNVFQNITHDLSAVLNPSDERNRSILPRDLKTAVKFVDVVAE